MDRYSPEQMRNGDQVLNWSRLDQARMAHEPQTGQARKDLIPERYHAAKEAFGVIEEVTGKLPFPATEVLKMEDSLVGGAAYKPGEYSHGYTYYRSLDADDRTAMVTAAREEIGRLTDLKTELTLLHKVMTHAGVDVNQMNAATRMIWEQKLLPQVADPAVNYKVLETQLADRLAKTRYRAILRDQLWSHQEDYLWMKITGKTKEPPKPDQSAGQPVDKENRELPFGGLEIQTCNVPSGTHPEISMDVPRVVEWFDSATKHKMVRLMIFDGSGGTLTDKVPQRDQLIAKQAALGADVAAQNINLSPDMALIAAHNRMSAQPTYGEEYALAAAVVVDIDTVTGKVKAASVGDCNVLTYRGGQGYDHKRAYDPDSVPDSIQQQFRPDNEAEKYRQRGFMQSRDMEFSPQANYVDGLIGQGGEDISRSIQMVEIDLSPGEILFIASDGVCHNSIVAEPEPGSNNTLKMKFLEMAKGINKGDAFALPKFASQVEAFATSGPQDIRDDMGAYLVRWPGNNASA